MISRRKLVIALGAAVLASPLTPHAQPQSKVWRVGFLASRHLDFVETDIFVGSFRQGMRDLGYVEGRNLVIEWRSAEGKPESLAGLANELVNLKVDLIVTAGSLATGAAQKATTTIPIVMGTVGDPVRDGFVKSLARPGGNTTGGMNMSGEVSQKQVEMLLDMVPGLSRVALLLNPANPSNVMTAARVQAEAQKRGLKVLRLEAKSFPEIDTAFAVMRKQNAGALIVLPETFFQQQKKQIAELAAKHRLPAVAQDRIFAEAGILMSYGPNLADQYRRAAAYVDKIFKGAKPGDLPVEQPTRFDLVINGKTAKALGLKIPQSLLISADKVID